MIFLSTAEGSKRPCNLLYISISQEKKWSKEISLKQAWVDEEEQVPLQNTSRLPDDENIKALWPKENTAATKYVLAIVSQIYTHMVVMN